MDEHIRVPQVQRKRQRRSQKEIEDTEKDVKRYVLMLKLVRIFIMDRIVRNNTDDGVQKDCQ